MDYSKYFGSSIRGFCYLMLNILHQIYNFVNFRLSSFPPSPNATNCIRTKPSRHLLVKPNCHRLICLWPLLSSHYLGYPMRKLMSITRGGGQLYSTGFSTSPPTVVLKSGKSHTLISEQFANRLANLSCIHISEWEYTFWVTYVF